MTYEIGRDIERLRSEIDALCARHELHVSDGHAAMPEHEHAHSHAEHALTEHVHTDPDEIIPALVELADEAGESVEAEATATAEEVAEPEDDKPSTPEPEVAPRRAHPMHRRIVGRRDAE